MNKYNLSKVLVLFLSVLLFSCSNEDDNYKTFEGPQQALLFNKETSLLEVFSNQPSFVEVLVSSTVTSNVDRTIPISVSTFSNATPSMYSIDMSTAVIKAGQTTAKVKVNAGSFLALPATGAKQLVLVLDTNEYILPNRTNNVVNIQRGCADTRVNFNISFDAWASETSWSLTKAGVVIASASAGTYSNGTAAHNQQFCLTPGNYTFVINDSYSDGLSDPSNGSYSLKLLDNTVLVSGGGNFGASSTHTFTIN
jgi:hypothetical protein